MTSDFIPALYNGRKITSNLRKKPKTDLGYDLQISKRGKLY